MTLSFLDNIEEARKIYNFCGSKSGRDLDKVKETGLVPVETDNGSIAFDQSRLTLECRKLYKDSMTAEKFLDKDLLQWYGAKGGFHDFTPMDFVVEILESIFFKSQAEAEAIMLKVHHEEKAVVGTYSYDIAKSKVEKAMEKARTQKFPLKLTYMPE